MFPKGTYHGVLRAAFGAKAYVEVTHVTAWPAVGLPHLAGTVLEAPVEVVLAAEGRPDTYIASMCGALDQAIAMMPPEDAGDLRTLRMHLGGP